MGACLKTCMILFFQTCSKSYTSDIFSVSSWKKNFCLFSSKLFFHRSSTKLLTRTGLAEPEGQNVFNPPPLLEFGRSVNSIQTGERGQIIPTPLLLAPGFQPFHRLWRARRSFWPLYFYIFIFYPSELKNNADKLIANWIFRLVTLS